MDDKEKIQSFGDMVDATERMSTPWREECERLNASRDKDRLHHTIQLIACNVLWAIIVAMLIWFAYMTPVDVGQEQDLGQQTQTQTYSQGVTDGD